MPRPLILATLLALAAISLAPLPAAARVRCRDFASQAEAQAYMQQHQATSLDGDKDGIACESLPHRGGATPAPMSARPSAAQQSQLTATVLSVGDGDTFRVQSQGKTITVRLACVDAPEMAQAPYGQAAAQRLKQLLPRGQRVVLSVVETDRYGRTVAEVYAGNTSVNLQLVKEGLAVVYPQYLKGCPGLRTPLLQAEQQAKQRRLQFWSQSQPMMPWDYRRQKRG